MGTQYLVPSANATDTDGILTTNNFEELDNGPTTDSVNGVVSVGGSEVGVGIAIFQLTNPDESPIAKITSATLYARARIQNITDDTVTWRIRGVHTGGNADLTWIETDTTYTTQNVALTSPTISSLTSMTVEIENTVYAATKGSDNATFEIDEIWVEVVYEDEPNVRYWVGGTGTWTTTSTTNWAITSGGTAGYLPPKGNVDVFFDANSDSGSAFTVTRSSTDPVALSCANLTVSGLDQVMTFGGGSSSYINLNGSLQFPSSNFNHSYSGTYQFLANSGTHYINTSNNGNFIITGGPSATYELSQDLNIGTDALIVLGGTFNANNKNVAADRFRCWGNRSKTVYMGSGTWNISGWVINNSQTVWDVQPANTTLYANTSNIWLSANNTNDKQRVFRSYDQTYHILTIGSGSLPSNVVITGSNNTFYDIRSDKTGAFDLLISSNTTHKTNNFSVSGTNGNLVSLSSTTTLPYKTLTEEDRTLYGYSVDITQDYIFIGNRQSSNTINRAINIYHRGNTELNYVIFPASDFYFTASNTYLMLETAQSLDTVNACYASNGTQIWSQSAELGFGQAMAISPNEQYVTIGAPNHTQAQLGQGKAYVLYSSNGTTLHTLNAPTAEDSGKFGQAVAMTNDYFVIAAPGIDSATSTSVGEVYVYYTSNGALKYTITSPVDVNSYFFGGELGVSANNDILMVGARRGYTTSTNLHMYTLSTGTLLYSIPLSNLWDADISDSYIAASNTIPTSILAVNIYEYNSSNYTFKYTIYNPKYSLLRDSSDTLFGRGQYPIKISDDELALVIGEPYATTPVYSNTATNVLSSFTTQAGVAHLYDLVKKEHKLEKLGDDIVSVDYLDISYSNVTPNTLTWYAGENSVNNSIWTQQQQQKLTASDAEDGDAFGWSVAIYGDTAVIGAYLEDGAGTDRGAAYVFTRSGTTWTQQQKLTASDAEDDDTFGDSVAISSDTVIVGAPSEDGTGGASRGAAYVFTRSGTTWTQQQKLTASDAEDDDRFGNSVAIDGDTAVVGAEFEDGAVASSSRGAAYVFTRSGTTWTQQQKLTASDAADSDRFGHSVSIAGDSVVVGAFGEDGAGTDRGAAYVFTRSAGTWTEQQKLTASDAEDDDRFGDSVAISSDTVIVGARLEGGGGTNRGAAYLFTRSGTTWTQQQKLTASDAEDNDFLGYSVSIDGDTAVVGAYGEDGGGSSRGAAYTFDNVNLNPGWIFTAPVTSAGNFFLLF